MQWQYLVLTMSFFISFIRVQRKIHLQFLFFILSSDMSASTYFILGLSLCTFLIIIVPFPSVTIPRLCEATFHHLSSMSFPGIFPQLQGSWATTKSPAPTSRGPPFSLWEYHWIPSHCLSLLHAQGHQMCHFNHSPVTKAFSGDKDWQAMTSPLPTLLCTYHPSPRPSHMVICPRLLCSPVPCPWRTSKKHMPCCYPQCGRL